MRRAPVRSLLRFLFSFSADHRRTRTITVDRLAREPHTVVISCELDLNLEVLKKRIWQKMGFNR